MLRSLVFGDESGQPEESFLTIPICLSVRFWETVPLTRTTDIGALLPLAYNRYEDGEGQTRRWKASAGESGELIIVR